MKNIIRLLAMLIIVMNGITASAEIPVGTPLSVKLEKKISEKIVKKLNSVRIIVAEDVVIDGDVAISIGTPIENEVIKGKDGFQINIVSINVNGEKYLLKGSPIKFDKSKGMIKTVIIGNGGIIGEIKNNKKKNQQRLQKEYDAGTVFIVEIAGVQ